MRAKDLAAFIKARENHKLFKEGSIGKAQFKNDPIIAKYRFCNVHREDDRVSKYVRQWSQKWAGNPDQWFAFVVARLFNLPASLAFISKTVVPFKPDEMRRKLVLMRKTMNIFNAAYIVSTNGRAMDKVDYVIDIVLKPLWEDRKMYRPKRDVAHIPFQFNMYHTRLMRAQGLGSFMAAQIIADLKYELPFYEKELLLPTSYADDWYDFAASGPGSRRGLNWVCGRAFDAAWREDDWRLKIAELHRELLPLLPSAIGAKLHMQDLQNCLCELFKYVRAKETGQMPKQRYVPYDDRGL